MGQFFGGGSARRKAAREAQIARESQKVANDRQLSALNKSEEGTVLSRKAPRGRRLFSDAARDGLPGNLA